MSGDVGSGISPTASVFSLLVASKFSNAVFDFSKSVSAFSPLILYKPRATSAAAAAATPILPTPFRFFNFDNPGMFGISKLSVLEFKFICSSIDKILL